MARRKGKYLGLWLLLGCCTLYLPFRSYLADSGYENAEEFFQDLLVGAILLSAVVLVVVVIYLIFFKSPGGEKPKTGK
jgi:hypothetical protein